MGEKLFNGLTHSAVMAAHFKPANLPAQWPTGVPTGVTAVLEKGLAQHPSHRYETAEALVTALTSLELQPVNQKLHAPRSEVTPSTQPRTQLTDPIDQVSAKVDTSQQIFVARQQELDRLNACLETALGQRGQAAFIVGEAGQGKSTLLAQFAQQSHTTYPELIITSGNCNAYTGSGDPYLPFREILEQLTGDSDGQAVTAIFGQNHGHRLQKIGAITAQAIVEVGPDLLNRMVSARSLLNRAMTLAPGATWLAELQKLAAHAEDQAQMGVQQSALFEQYVKVLYRVSQQVPLLLVLDDLHWIDAGSADLLLHLGRRLTNSPLLLIGAYRPAEIALSRDGARHPLEKVIHEFQRQFGEVLFDLSQTEGEAFVDALLDLEPNTLNQTFRRTLYQQTRGHPLFTVELLKGMKERGDIVRDETGRWVAQPKLDWDTLPARVEGAIGERISRLEAPLAELLQVASIEGETFSAETVAQALNLDKRTVLHQLSQELDKKHQLVRAIGIRREGALRLSRYRFRHILIQRYLYSMLNEVERLYQHEMVGQTLETLYEQQVGEIAISLAHHFESAEMLEEAAPYLYQAGDQAWQAVALEEAIRYYRRALKHWPKADKAGQATIQRKLGECLWIVGRLEAAQHILESGYSLFDSLDDKINAGAVQRLLGSIIYERGDREQSLQHYYRAVAILEEAPESVELARAVSSISRMKALSGEFDEATAWGERALTLAENLQAKDVSLHALNNIGLAYMNIGQARRGQQFLERSLAQALELALPYDVCRAYLNITDGLLGLARYEEQRIMLQELLTYAKRIPVPGFAGIAVSELVRLDWYKGNWRSALARIQTTFDWIKHSPSITITVVLAHTQLGQMFNDLGRPKIARLHLDYIAEQIEGIEAQITAPYLVQVARSQVLLGLDDEAQQTILTLLAALDQEPQINLCVLSDTMLFPISWLKSREISELAELIEAFVTYLERAKKQSGESLEFDAGASEGRGIIAFYDGRLEEAVEHFQQAADLWHSINRPYDRLRALYGLIQALSESEETSEREAITKTALSIIDGLTEELDDEILKTSFLNSSLVRAVVKTRGD